MNLSDYYKILDLPVTASLNDIRKAYRAKARLCHPDVNPSPDAVEMFIRVTEAYEFLISHHDRIRADEEAFSQAMEDWRKYRQNPTRRKAAAYARAPYKKFRNSNLYKTTKIFDGTRIIFSLVISVMILIYTVAGYFYRLKHPLPGIENPSVVGFILLLLMGMLFFIVSFVYLRAWIETMHKIKHDKDTVA